jgi:Minichromosome loss protein, Mcl1, middle region
VDSAPTDILWEKNDTVERVLIACASGKLLIIEGRDNIIPRNLKSLDSDKKAKMSENPTNDIISHKIEISDDNHIDGVDNENDEENFPKDFNDDEEPDDEVQLPKSKKTASSKKNSVAFVDDEAVDVDEYSTEDVGLVKGEPAGLDRLDSLVADRAADDGIYDDASDYDDYDGTHKRTSAFNLPEPQAPFGVSATPLDLTRRYLCWNNVGSITLFRGGDEVASTRNAIEINFTDTLSHRNISFTDNLGFILGSLGEDGAIFATDLAGDNDDDDGVDYMQGMSSKIKEAIKKEKRSSQDCKPTGSTLYFNRFETFASIRDKDWVLTLPTGERAVGCSSGEGWVAAITRYVTNVVQSHPQQVSHHTSW